MILLSYAAKDVGAENRWSHVAHIDSFENESDAYQAMIHIDTALLKAKPFLFVILTEETEYGHVIGFSMMYKKKLLSVTRDEMLGNGKTSANLNLNKQLTKAVAAYTTPNEPSLFARNLDVLSDDIIHQLAMDLFQIVPVEDRHPIYQDVLSHLRGEISYRSMIPDIERAKSLYSFPRATASFAMVFDPSTPWSKSGRFNAMNQEILDSMVNRAIEISAAGALLSKNREYARVTRLQLEIMRRRVTLAEFILPRML